MLGRAGVLAAGAAQAHRAIGIEGAKRISHGVLGVGSTFGARARHRPQGAESVPSPQSRCRHGAPARIASRRLRRPIPVLVPIRPNLVRPAAAMPDRRCRCTTAQLR
ncbi:MAG: hypothetical protein MZW92_77570 [Comamonadaceae bacterium]|nr:hypothetical protein [Comamonadaceae bacterium]